MNEGGKMYEIQSQYPLPFCPHPRWIKWSYLAVRVLVYTNGLMSETRSSFRSFLCILATILLTVIQFNSEFIIPHLKSWVPISTLKASLNLFLPSINFGQRITRIPNPHIWQGSRDIYSIKNRAMVSRKKLRWVKFNSSCSFPSIVEEFIQYLY